MESKINIKDIYQQNLNFLIGSGASSGLFPTLWLPLKDSEDNRKTETIETLATKFSDLGHDKHLALLFMYYYQEIIEPVIKFKVSDIDMNHDCSIADCLTCHKRGVIKNYEAFLETLILILIEKDCFTRRCNLFTTNYDGCIPLVADEILQSGRYDFLVNDGSSGFLKKTLRAKNFNNYTCQSGVFNRHANDIPQLNLLNIHGSAYWKKDKDTIIVNYENDFSGLLDPAAQGKIDELKAVLNDGNKDTDDIVAIDVDLADDLIETFWSEYKQLPIVNPTKWKFHETVFEEHYYQMLRLLSYELEKPNSVLITFAFSFADEHIENLVKRSLSNPKLKVYICCFNKREYLAMNGRFSTNRNVTLISLGGEDLDFTQFNEQVFNFDGIADIANDD